jgi:hypothetical protein
MKFFCQELSGCLKLGARSPLAELLRLKITGKLALGLQQSWAEFRPFSCTHGQNLPGVSPIPTIASKLLWHNDLRHCFAGDWSAYSLKG